MINLFIDKTKNSKDDVLSGLTVALALVPEAIAFAMVALVDPMVGLWAAFFVGIITSIFGGRPGMISGATGAMAVVMTALVMSHGAAYLFAAVVLAGIIQILFGMFKFGKFVRLIPQPVMIGFVNGLAIVIGYAQFNQFKENIAAEGEPAVLAWLGSDKLIVMGLIILGVMAIMHFLPKITRAIPSGLLAIVLATLASYFLGLGTKTVGDIAPAIADGSIPFLDRLPSFILPDFSFSTLAIIYPTAFILAAIGLIESLMTLTLIDEITKTTGKPNKESVAQGAANVVSGLFGTMGGCAMIGQSMININSGGRGRASGITAAVALLIFILFGGPIIALIPIAALVGVMFMVVIGTFEWASFNMIKKVRVPDLIIIGIVTGVTLYKDLAIAVIVGVIVSALVYAWDSAKKISASQIQLEDGAVCYEIHGSIFFASITAFKELFNPENDPKEVYIDFADSRVYDHSAVDAINAVTQMYKEEGKKIHLKHLSPDCRQLLVDADDLIEVNLEEDPSYHIADDKLA
jgi:sulfate permease, SulP family